jgi:hypothetical protein
MGHFGILRRLFWWALAVAVLRPGLAAASPEQTFPVLQIGTQTYSNVTVTTKAPAYIFILHSSGMASIKVKELSPELRMQLGYDQSGKPASAGDSTAVWARQTLTKMDTPQIREAEKQLRKTWRKWLLAPLQKPGLMHSWTAQIALGILAALYFFFCHCCMLIGQKTGINPGPLAWIPFLQPIPLLRAAGMSPWWILAGPVPILNLVAWIRWSVKIAKARGKNTLVGLLLLVPFINWWVFVYLAYSNGAPPKSQKPEKPVPVITLEAA